MMVAFVAWKGLYHGAHPVLRRFSRWYRSLGDGEQRFVRAYIVRCLWALQAIYTSLRTLGLLKGTRGRSVFGVERRDKILGWSRLYAPPRMGTD
jgi:hypothetical protein